MIINVDLSTRSINKAIKQLKKAETLIVDKLVKEYLLECSREIIKLSNLYLSMIDIGEDVKAEIMSGWENPHYDKVLHQVVLTNHCIKAVFVEFGTGIVGQENPHPNAEEQGYEYNVKSDYKIDGKWIFKQPDDSKVDIAPAYIIKRTTHTVSTKGMPSTLFVYNAIQNFIDTKRYQTIWKNITRKYFN